VLVAVSPDPDAAEAGGERIDIIDLATMAATPLVTMPAGSVAPDSMLTGLSFGAAAWTNDGARLAILRTAAPPAWIYEIDQDAFVSPFSVSDDEVQDALGRLAPEENPYFQMNAIELVELASAAGGDDASPRHVATLSVPLLGPDLFGGSRWSADGEIRPSRRSNHPASLAARTPCTRQSFPNRAPGAFSAPMGSRWAPSPGRRSTIRTRA